MISSNYDSSGIEHLAFGVNEVVYDYDYNFGTEPVSVPIKIVGEVLKIDFIVNLLHP